MIYTDENWKPPVTYCEPNKTEVQRMNKQEAIDILAGLYRIPVENGADEFASEINKAIDMAIKALQDDWIPVSERLPEDGYWLWSSTSGEVKIDFCWKGHWGQAEALGYDVIAWQPLPEPYKGGDIE